MEMKRESEQARRVGVGHPAVGIVVKNGGQAERRPRAVAFVWGGKVRPTPSLPYGRWKKALAAA
jgi:hypothetical protein